MRKSKIVNRGIATLLALGLAAAPMAGCGTLMYPERQGQVSGRIDPAVLLFDGALLFVFIVPGIVAYGIDFHTGAIYLPSGKRNVSVIEVDPDALSHARAREIVRVHTGAEIPADRSEFEVRQLEPGSSLADLIDALQVAPSPPAA